MYAPTECSSSSGQEDLYISLKEHLDQAKKREIDFILGDFNARVGMHSQVYPHVIVDKYCYYDTRNINGERLVNLC